MGNILAKNKGFFFALALAGYFCSYAILWGSREETKFSLTVDHGCIQKTREVPTLRFEWMESSGLKPVITVLYWPVNALLISQSDWR
jgi:hypothetical protein